MKFTRLFLQIGPVKRILKEVNTPYALRHMDPYPAIFNRLYSQLPELTRWMQRTRERYLSSATAVAELGFKKIDVVYPPNIRNFAKLVADFEHVPVPSFTQMGLEQLKEFEGLNPVGITFNDMIYLQEGYFDEMTCFHEMIHVVQWKHLGIEKFLISYGVLQAVHGYKDNPFEQIAQYYQERLESNALPMNFLEKTRQHAIDTWNSVNPLYRFSESLLDG